jgi:hypothetical protein
LPNLLQVFSSFARFFLLFLTQNQKHKQIENLLKAGDVLLSIDGKLTTNFEELERNTKLCSEVAELTIFRKQLIVFQVKPVVLSSQGTEKCAIWAGALLADCHRGMLQTGKIPKGVLCSRWFLG